jgi:hypothetical protein
MSVYFGGVEKADGAMTDCGYGIRIFSTMAELVGYLELIEFKEGETGSIDGIEFLPHCYANS